MMKISRRTFIKLTSAAVWAGGSGIAYAACVEPRWLRTTFKEIAGIGLKRRIRVLHLSDFHAWWCVSRDLIREEVEIGLSHQPDLVFLTEDFVTNTHYDISNYPKDLESLKQHPACFACLGNHDGKYRINGEGAPRARLIEGKLLSVGIKLVHNRSVDLNVQGNAIKVAGLGDLWRKEVEPGCCLTAPGEDPTPTLLLAHNPDTKEKVAEYDWDVMFS